MDEYMTQKCELLKDFGINNENALRLHFRREIMGITDDTKKEMKIERLCHDIIKNYLHGDKTYCIKNKRANEYLERVKAKYEKADAVYEDAIIEIVGQEGLMELRKNHLIETCGLIEGRKLYAI